MAFREIYRRQVQLLIRVLPSIGEEACFALKGGTAINLFVRDMPRLVGRHRSHLPRAYPSNLFLERAKTQTSSTVLHGLHWYSKHTVSGLPRSRRRT